MSEFITDRIHIMLKYGFKKVEQLPDGKSIIADNKYYYPTAWIEDDYIFFHHIIKGVFDND